jgi:hypothetical protein
VVDPGALPHEEVAAVEEDVQAEECKHAAEAKCRNYVTSGKKIASFWVIIKP